MSFEKWRKKSYPLKIYNGFEKINIDNETNLFKNH